MQDQKRQIPVQDYEKRGYLHQNYRIFHLTDQCQQEFAYHYHDFNKILILLKGTVTYYIEGNSYVLSPYDIVLVKAGELHRPVVSGSGSYERIILYVSPDFLASYQQEQYDLGLCFSRAQKEQSGVLRMPSLKSSRLYQILGELEAGLSSQEYACELYQDVLFLEFLIHLNRAAFQDTLQFLPTQPGNDKILSVLSYLNGHLKEPLSVDSIADTFFLNKYYLMHAFKKETGYTLCQYLNLKRLLKGRELIRQGIPVTEACLLCGFGSYSAFSRAYKKQFGEAPRQLSRLLK